MAVLAVLTQPPDESAQPPIAHRSTSQQPQPPLLAGQPECSADGAEQALAERPRGGCLPLRCRAWYSTR